jgi:hypothetical protein
MRSLFSILQFAVLCIAVVHPVAAQDDKASRPSPPAEAKAMIGEAMVSVNYSAPAVKGRKVWGSLVPYGKVWRTGANEATVFETSADLMINGQKLPAGKYALFTIPGETEWTFIFNSVWEQWGAYRYDAEKDVLRVTAVPAASSAFHERLTFHIHDHTVSLMWENLEVGFEVKP